MAEVSSALIGIMSVDNSMGESLADAGVVKLAASLLVVKVSVELLSVGISTHLYS